MFICRSIFAVLDKMKIDMANFAVSSLRPHLLQQSVEYERKKFQDFLDKQPSEENQLLDSNYSKSINVMLCRDNIGLKKHGYPSCTLVL